MTALVIIGGILLFLLLLTLIPVRAELAFKEEFALTLRYLFLRIPVLPGKEKLEEPEEKPPKKEPKEGKRPVDRLKEVLKRKGLGGFLQSLLDFVKEALGASGKMLKHLKLRRFDLYLCLGGAADAAGAAILYGQVSAAVYGALGVLFRLIPCKKKGVTVDLDYSAAEHRVDFTATLSLRPVFAVLAGLRIVWNALLLLLRLRRGKGPRVREEKA